MEPGLDGSALRRAPACYATWSRNRLLIGNAATGTRLEASPVDLALTSALDDWTEAEEVESLWVSAGGDSQELDRRLGALLDAQALETRTRRARSAREIVRNWHRWAPLASVFHFATKDVEFLPRGQRGLRVAWREYPDPLKAYPHRPSVVLPEHPRDTPLAEVLLQRRTWRQFDPRALSLSELSYLLGLTWGVQRWMDLGFERPVPLKTAPSGGSRHSLEAYVVVRNVEGLEAGAYHYDPDRHGLSQLHAEAPTDEQLEAFLPTQYWFHRAAAFVFMTSVLPRVWWRYEHPRAYRVVLHEAGHFAQSFCLLATERGLAPFCTAALGDTALEEYLGVDGMEEVALYAVGVGHRPEELDWAPDPDRDVSPPTWRPAHEKRSEDGG